MIKVGVVGGSGRLGVELLRLLVMHPNVRIQAVTSRTYCGQRVQDCFPMFRHHFEAEYVQPDVAAFSKCDVVFFATPTGVALELAPPLLEKKIRVIDLSDDFRIRDLSFWQQHHGMSHPHPTLLEEAVIGFPETRRQQLRKARLVAMPRPETTLVQLALLPLYEQPTLIDPAPLTGTLIAGASQGLDLGGRVTLQCGAEGICGSELDVATVHELQCALNALAGNPVSFCLVPHQVPVSRGLQATLFVRLRASTQLDLQALYLQRFEEEPFVDVQPPHHSVDSSTVQGANMCRLSVQRSADGQTAVILGVIDNLIKGSTGQALQVMNVMHGIPETIGLKHLALMH